MVVRSPTRRSPLALAWSCPCPPASASARSPKFPEARPVSSAAALSIKRTSGGSDILDSHGVRTILCTRCRCDVGDILLQTGCGRLLLDPGGQPQLQLERSRRCGSIASIEFDSSASAASPAASPDRSASRRDARELPAHLGPSSAPPRQLIALRRNNHTCLPLRTSSLFILIFIPFLLLAIRSPARCRPIRARARQSHVALERPPRRLAAPALARARDAHGHAQGRNIAQCRRSALAAQCQAELPRCVPRRSEARFSASNYARPLRC